jgi:hypothetical protein
MAQSYTNSSSVLNASGRRSAAGSYVNVSGSGQSGGVAASAGGAIVNVAGFFGAVALRPDLDTDGDGMPNELDLDNDNDGLTDSEETSGIAFEPATPTDMNDADSDGDTFDDGAEALAGTDPTSSASLLKITAVRESGGYVVVEWLARSGNAYHVKRVDTLTGSDAVTLGTVTAQGPGSPPWYGTTATFYDTGAYTATAFYWIDVAEE